MGRVSAADTASSRNALTASSDSSAAVLVPSDGSFLSTAVGAVMMWHCISSASITLKTSRVDAQMISTFVVRRARVQAHGGMRLGHDPASRSQLIQHLEAAVKKIHASDRADSGVRPNACVHNGCEW